MRRVFFVIALIFSLGVYSQRWHFQYGFKFGVGESFHQGDSAVNKGTNFNYQIGFAGRVTKKNLIMDFGVLYHYSPYFNSDYYGHTRTNTMGLNIPFTAGVVLINKPLFKWNLQAGIQNSFIFSDGFSKKWPSEAMTYAPYQLSGLLTTGIEVAWFIFDVNYQPGISPMFKGVSEHWNHSLNFSIGLIF